MHKFDVYQTRANYGKLEPLGIKRSWMDETYEAHAYKCFPVSLSNALGWGISFPEDISFIWDGISNSESDHVKILSGEKYAHNTRGNATISFNTGLLFRTEENLSIMGMPVPNQFIDGAHPFTGVISTSFFKGEFPVAWRITRPNTVITIKAGTPVISIMPISLQELNNSEAVVRDMFELPPGFFPDDKYGDIVYEINKAGKWTNFYRDGVDHYGNKIGDHEIKALRLKINDGKPVACSDK